MALAPKVVTKLRERGVDIPVVVGGIIPAKDVEKLKAAGVSEVLTPGAAPEDVVAIIRRAIDSNATAK
jgi:methylmalonyl-CoA mutase cobalamin-binding domain/chain